MQQASSDAKPVPVTPKTLYWASQATMCVSICAFFYECYAYNMIFLRRILPAVGKTSLVAPYRVLFNLFWGLALWSYHQAHWADPGAVPPRWTQFVKSVGDALPISPARPEWQPAKATLCKKCKVPRPERAHHCVLCNFCVMRMDHHCPWINNCVGIHNHKFFLLLASYAWLASLIAVGSSLPELWRFAGVALHVQEQGLVTTMLKESSFVKGADELSMWEIYGFMVFGFFAFMIGLLLTSLLSTHVPLALRNLTTIEDFYENMPNPFDMGSRVGNLSQVFGSWGCDWLFPVRPCKPLSDGVVYSPLDGFHLEDFQAGPDRIGHDFSVDEAVNVALLYKEGKETEIDRLWKVRYKVRSAEEMKARDADKLSPFMAQFWACGRGSSRHTNGSGSNNSSREYTGASGNQRSQKKLGGPGGFG